MKRRFSYVYIVVVILLFPLLRSAQKPWQYAPLKAYVLKFSNLIPLKGIIAAITNATNSHSAYYLFPLIFNLFVMVPVGVFYGYSSRYINFKRAILDCIKYGILFAFLYCVRILLKLGCFDIDDILLNCVGLYFGMVLGNQVKRRLLSK
ncbi:MAG: hypothetical protein HFF61_10640 [Oscillospiraceae bacterium]|nr:hypothetical protein [Oscillospiraceae bacterium]